MQPTNSLQPKTERAFTLIELLVVIAIVGILAGLAVVNMSGATEAARIAKLKVYSNSIRSSLMGNRVSEWKFDEGTGTSTADTVGTNSGILVSNPAWRSSANCVSGSCLQFNGTSDYINAGNAASLDFGTGTFTIETWVKTTDFATANWVGLVGKWSSSGYYLQYFPSTSVWAFGWHSSTYLNPTKNIADGNWHHIVGVRTGSTFAKLYVDGGLIGSHNSIPNISSDTTENLNIGRLSPGLGRYLNGSIDEVRIYGAALTASIIHDRYVSGLDKLLDSDQITEQNYKQRLADLNSTYAASE
jgi:prepilin-type N-terminal cleavage/methylation domain-containing protein